MKKIVAITPDQKHDYLCESTLEGLLELGCEISVSDPGNGFDVTCDENELVQRAKDADHVIVFFGKVRGNRPPKRHLLDRMTNVRDKLAYIEDAEWTCTAYPLPGQVVAAKHNPFFRRGEPWLDEDMLRTCRWYFKHSCYPQDVERGVLPFQISIVKRTVMPPRVKDIDLLCSFGQTNDGLRREALEVCNTLKKTSNLNIVTDNGMSKERYYDILSRSRIVVDAWGGSEMNARFLEAVGNGACVLHQRFTTIMLEPFANWKQAVSYATLDEFKSVVKTLLDERELSITIGESARKHAEEHHMAAKRAQHLLRMIAK